MSHPTQLHTTDQVPWATVIEQEAQINSRGCANIGKSPAPSGRNLTAHVNTHHPQSCTAMPGKLRWGQNNSSQGDLTLYLQQDTLTLTNTVAVSMENRHQIEVIYQKKKSVNSYIFPHLKQNTCTYKENCYSNPGTKSTVTKCLCDLSARSAKGVQEGGWL